MGKPVKAWRGTGYSGRCKSVGLPNRTVQPEWQAYYQHLERSALSLGASSIVLISHRYPMLFVLFQQAMTSAKGSSMAFERKDVLVRAGGCSTLARPHLCHQAHL